MDGLCGRERLEKGYEHGQSDLRTATGSCYVSARRDQIGVSHFSNRVLHRDLVG